MPDYKIHPAADHWPILPADELQALADSIADVGLLEPVVLWPNEAGELVVLDGRNRLAACELAGIEPVFETIDGSVDPVAYVLARNETRRHMTKGSRAMSAWMTASTGSLTINASELAAGHDLNSGMVRWAKAVAEHAPDLVPNVTAGAVPLKTAYDEAVERKRAAATLEQRLDDLPPDLAATVREEQRTLEAAEDEARGRAERAEAERRNHKELVDRTVDNLRRLVGVLGTPSMMEGLSGAWANVHPPVADDERRNAIRALLQLMESE